MRLRDALAAVVPIFAALVALLSLVDREDAEQYCPTQEQVWGAWTATPTMFQMQAAVTPSESLESEEAKHGGTTLLNASEVNASEDPGPSLESPASGPAQPGREEGETLLHNLSRSPSTVANLSSALPDASREQAGGSVESIRPSAEGVLPLTLVAMRAADAIKIWLQSTRSRVGNRLHNGFEDPLLLFGIFSLLALPAVAFWCLLAFHTQEKAGEEARMSSRANLLNKEHRGVTPGTSNLTEPSPRPVARPVGSSVSRLQTVQKDVSSKKSLVPINSSSLPGSRRASPLLPLSTPKLEPTAWNGEAIARQLCPELVVPESGEITLLLPSFEKSMLEEPGKMIEIKNARDVALFHVTFEALSSQELENAPSKSVSTLAARSTIGSGHRIILASATVDAVWAYCSEAVSSGTSSLPTVGGNTIGTSPTPSHLAIRKHNHEHFADLGPFSRPDLGSGYCIATQLGWNIYFIHGGRDHSWRVLDDCGRPVALSEALSETMPFKRDDASRSLTVGPLMDAGLALLSLFGIDWLESGKGETSRRAPVN